tara:strand:+ start:390 stop:539 length:150 start_codon:yes stop_codon:yes gene_type:complete
MLTWQVTMEKNGKRWTSNTMACSKLQAMLQMTNKYGCGAKAVDAVVVQS